MLGGPISPETPAPRSALRHRTPATRQGMHPPQQLRFGPAPTRADATAGITTAAAGGGGGGMGMEGTGEPERTPYEPYARPSSAPESRAAETAQQVDDEVTWLSC
jgi:hypothetical protein